MRPLVLASASPRRRELLTELGVVFRVDPAHVDESIAPGTPPDVAARELAERKARVVAARSAAAGSSDPVLAADTIVAAADGGILGKPASATQARAMLARLAGTTHRVITGVCLALDSGTRFRGASSTTLVTMRALTSDELDGYAASGESYGKAGGYAIQENGDRFVTRVEGSWTNVVGLPVELVETMLREEGVL